MERRWASRALPKSTLSLTTFSPHNSGQDTNMAKMTEREKTIAGLKAIGCIQDTDPRTSKYEVFVRGDRKFLVGSSGGLRVTTSTIAASTSLTGNKFHK